MHTRGPFAFLFLLYFSRKKAERTLNRRYTLFFPFFSTFLSFSFSSPCAFHSHSERQREGGHVRVGEKAAVEESAASVSNEFRISLADGRRDYFKEIRNYLIRREKVINSGETN